MLFDGHLILGYLIAKFLLEVFRVKSSDFHSLPSLASPAYGRSTSRLSQGVGVLQRLWRWFLQVPLEQRLMLWALGAAVLPDLDVLFTPLFGWHTFHRGITHSIFVMTAVAVGLSYFGAKVLQVPMAQAFAFTALPLLSHPLTDTAVNYGTKLFWPFSNALMSTGAITIWDLPFTLMMYTFLTVSRLRLMRPTPLFALFLASFVLYIAVRRIMIYEAAIRVRGVEPRYDTRLWVMPSNIWPGFYYVMFHKFGEAIRIATTVSTEYEYIRISESLFYPRWLHVRLTPPMRSYFWDLETESMLTVVYDSLPTVLFIVGYHIVYYFLTRSAKQSRQAHHAQSF